MPRELEIPNARKREYMKDWFAMGDTPEGLVQACEYLYRTPPSQLSPSGLMCIVAAAIDAMRDKDAEIAALHAKLADAQQGELFAPTAERYYIDRDSFVAYVADKVNPERLKAGLAVISMTAAENCYRIIASGAYRQPANAEAVSTGSSHGS